MNEFFRKFSSVTSDVVGSSWAFILAVAVIIVWAASGPAFNYSDTWQLVINTGTTIITFLMVFLIQNTQNRDAKALHLKLDELLRAVEGARTSMANLENLPDEELKKLQEEFQRICRTRGFGGSAVEAIDDELKERGVSGRVAK
ncbi:MAG TPA: low affinity iron permease family protein [Pyrinomonadaceae bacterium]|jgi:low affinity Fe/Cu permease|nr:low affinity iron permease family protein [Pyrinomonadaceae bacterium]